MKTILALCCLLPGLVASVQGAVICPHDSFTCLKRHMNDFYLADHDRFFKVYRHVFARALQCGDYQDVAEYLTIYSPSGDNAEIDESMQQDTEALLLLKPECLFEGALRLTPVQLDNFAGKYRLFSRPNHVMALLRKYMQNGKYRHVATLIYKSNQAAYQSYGKGADDAPMAELYQQYKQYQETE